MAQLHQFFRINFNLCQLYMCYSVFSFVSTLLYVICLYLGTFYLPQVWCFSSAFIGFPSSTYGFSFLYSIRFSNYYLPPVIIYLVFFFTFASLYNLLLHPLSHLTLFPFLPYYIPFPFYSFLFLSLLFSLSCFTSFPFYSTPFSFSSYSFPFLALLHSLFHSSPFSFSLYSFPFLVLLHSLSTLLLSLSHLTRFPFLLYYIPFPL